MKAYPKYKDSGVPWLGHVPEHWSVTRTKNIFRLRTETSGVDHGLELLSIYTHIGVRPRKSLEQKGNKASTTDNYWIVKRGDLIVNKLLAWMGAIGVSHYSGVTSPAYDILRSIQDINSDYYHHLFRTKLYLQQFKAWSRGIMDMRLRLYFDEFGQIASIAPPKKEQDQITKYLDWQTSKINKFIKAKKKLIALLKEQKQNVINEAVTKGINPDVEMKDSGVEWIGEIPAHWEVRKLKHCIRGKLKYGANASGTDYSPEFPRYIRITDFNSGGYLDEKKKLSLNIDTFEEYLLEEGDLLFARSGATVGKVFQCKKLEEPSCFAGYLIKAKPDLNVIASDFLYLYTQSLVFDKWKTSIFSKATIENIGADKYSQLLVVAPPIKEQYAIFEYLEIETALIDKTITRTEREIELIQEYRTRLVSDVVTGKVDVRSVDIPDFEPVEADLEAQDDEASEDELITEGIEA